MRSSFPRIVAVAGLLVLVVLSSLAWAGPREISSGGAKIGENQSTEGFAASALTVDSGGGTVVATIPVGGNPAGVAYNSGNGYVYVTNPFSDIVSVINGTTVVATVPVEYNPSGVAYDSGNGYVYVANDTTYVSVINGTTVVATVPVGGEPNALAYDSENGYVYVTNSDSQTVSVISGTVVVATVPVGDGPSGVAYDSGNGYVYVSNYCSGTVSVISAVEQPSFDFSLSSPSPGSISFVRGDTSPSSSITATLTTGSAVPVTITASDLPDGVTAYFTNNPCSPTCTVTVGFSATPSPIMDNVTTSISIVAAGGGSYYSVAISLMVRAPSDFSMSAGAVSPVQISAGSQGTSTIMATALSGFTGTVGLSVAASSPSGLTCTLPSSVSFGSSPQAATLSCGATAAGDYAVTVTGTSGSLTHTTSSILFHVVAASSPPPSFLGLPAPEGYALLAGISIAVVAKIGRAHV